MSAHIKSGAIPAALAPRALRVGDVIRLTRGAPPQIIVALAAREMTVHALVNSIPFTIPRPPIRRVMVLGTTAPTSRRPRVVSGAKLPAPVEPASEAPAGSYGSGGLDLASAF